MTASVTERLSMSVEVKEQDTCTSGEWALWVGLVCACISYSMVAVSS